MIMWGFFFAYTFASNSNKVITVKNLGTVLGGLSFVGVVVLFILQFSNTQSIENNQEAIDQVEESDSLDELKPRSGVVAYINTDSLMNNYTAAVNYRDELNADQVKYESQLAAAQKKLVNDYESYKAKAQTMSSFELQQRDRELQNRQQDLAKMERDLSQKLGAKEMELTKKINDELVTFLENYSKTHSYEVILSDNQMGAILWGSKSVDITKDVIDGMNATVITSTPEKD